MKISAWIASGFLAAFVGAVAVQNAGAGGEPARDDEALQRMVREEVQRQLPAAVEKEVRKAVTEYQKAEQQRVLEANIQAAHNSVRSTLQTMRSQIELYKIQHQDKAPSFEQLRGWKVLVEKTSSNGDVLPSGKFGPYLQEPPINPITHSSEVVPAGHATSRAGWTYEAGAERFKLRPILPTHLAHIRAFTDSGEYELPDAAKEAQREKYMGAHSMLQTLRSQLELYKIQHGNRPPTMEQMRDWKALLNRSGKGGTEFGPYLSGAPGNRMNGKSTIAPAGEATAETGWTYRAEGESYSIRVVVPDKAMLGELNLGADDAEVPAK